MKTSTKLAIQHHTNPLHVFCRLMGVGCPKKAALAISKWYERHIYRPIWA